MCGIAGIVSLDLTSIQHLEQKLEILNSIQAHRGPDGDGVWVNQNKSVGFAHRRLSIIDIDGGAQPMSDTSGLTIVFNGEIYNYLEIRDEIGEEEFVSSSDTEVILKSYLKWGKDCVNKLRGMFAFAIWDSRTGEIYCARDRIGIKPFYYHKNGNTLYFASEAKALLPFVPEIACEPSALKEYLTFQLYLEGKTLFKDIYELQPGCSIQIKNNTISIRRYWDIHFEPNFNHSEEYFNLELQRIFDESVSLHTRSDVPIGAYVSGGIDSSLVASSATQATKSSMKLFVGKFPFSKDYDESEYAREVSDQIGGHLYEVSITPDDLINNLQKVIYSLDYPVAGPGSFSQYMVSKAVSEHIKVILGGQGGDEIFGGYVRYLVAYFEQCILGAIDGTLDSGNFIVTYESIIPNLVALKNYKPMLKDFWKEGVFDSMDKRYFRLINRAPSLGDEIQWNYCNDYDPYEKFSDIFNAKNVGHRAYFDKMTHFDFKTLLPALLHIEDRVSMAHGLESRVPFLDHKLIEFAATAPPNIKFKDGHLKHWIISALGDRLPKKVRDRTDKMGFPTPINIWAKKEAKEFIQDIFNSSATKTRPFFNYPLLKDSLNNDSEYGRKLWGLLSLELWSQQFLDQASNFRKMGTVTPVTIN